MNTERKVGVSVKFNYEAEEGYMFQAMSSRKIEKMKLRSRYDFKPVLYVRTPEKELLVFNSSILYIGGKTFRASGKLEKLSKIPFSFNGR